MPKRSRLSFTSERSKGQPRHRILPPVRFKVNRGTAFPIGAPSEDADQPAHPCNLIVVLACYIQMVLVFS